MSEGRVEQVRMVRAEQKRLRPLKPESMSVMIELLRAGLELEEPGVVPVLNLGTIMGFEAERGGDGLRALALSLANLLTGMAHDFARVSGHTAQELVDFYQTELMAVMADHGPQDAAQQTSADEADGDEQENEQEAEQDERARQRAWVHDRLQLAALEPYAARQVVQLMTRLTDGAEHDVPEEALSTVDEVAAAQGWNGVRVLAVSLAGWAYESVERTAKVSGSPMAEAAKGVRPVFSSWPVPGIDGSMG
ncbi:hypothetical protein [Streptomyces sp. I05A-00742]|uniref:hypothetical protein n=1 Tax=Streptomyces sp. I05A-00742 TaxID=2732853 RepID=UPI00148764EA|nr:hypothetical protein [Streptomyces sp. I05A-00742]